MKYTLARHRLVSRPPSFLGARCAGCHGACFHLTIKHRAPWFPLLAMKRNSAWRRGWPHVLHEAVNKALSSSLGFPDLFNSTTDLYTLTIFLFPNIRSTFASLSRSLNDKLYLKCSGSTSYFLTCVFNGVSFFSSL